MYVCKHVQPHTHTSVHARRHIHIDIRIKVSCLLFCLHNSTSRFHGSVKERMDRAVHIAELALAKATVNKTEQSPSPGQPETDKAASDDASVIIEAFQKGRHGLHFLWKMS